MSSVRQVLISVYDKTGLCSFAEALCELGFTLVASGGTAATLKAAGLEVTDIYDVTGVEEMLGGRVKTLHPKIHGGILARDTPADMEDLKRKGITPFEIVVCNLYPFAHTISRADAKFEDAVENIDIGGVTLLRAAAKNHSRVTVVWDIDDYEPLLTEIRELGEIRGSTREILALKAFHLTAEYDNMIADYMKRKLGHNICQMPLRYGMNPHQLPAQVYTARMRLPFKVLNGSPGYINLCDALNGWQLVRELDEAFQMPAAASFKHLSPAGAGIAVPLSRKEAKVCMVEDLWEDMGLEFSPLATAYARARSADRMASFGDFAAFSSVCDLATARVLSREVSDGVIAPHYTEEALEILKKKKNGNYCIVEMDPNYIPDETETRQIFGLILEQKRNDMVLDDKIFQNCVTKNIKLTGDAKRDLLLATISLKYAQSNSVCYAKRGQVIGLGVGQQSRIHCTRLAGDKVDNWWLRHHENALILNFKDNVTRPQKANAMDNYVRGNVGKTMTLESFESLLRTPAPLLTEQEREKWITELDDVCLSSDAFFPFRDNIDRANKSGVKYIISPGGSVNDQDVIQACEEYGICMIHTGIRLFTH